MNPTQASWLSQNWTYVVLIIVIIIIVIAFILFIENFNPFCIGALGGGSLCNIVGGSLGSGTTTGSDQGAYCVIDTDCKGWKILGTTACCGNTCVTKDAASETCPQYCDRHPESKCGTKIGQSCSFDSDCNGWSIGGKVACCNSVCVTKDQSVETCSGFCSGQPQACGLPSGTQWCVVDSDCPGWTLFGTSACCYNRCITKDQSVETCGAFCERHPDSCKNVIPPA